MPFNRVWIISTYQLLSILKEIKELLSFPRSAKPKVGAGKTGSKSVAGIFTNFSDPPSAKLGIVLPYADLYDASYTLPRSESISTKRFLTSIAV